MDKLIQILLLITFLTLHILGAASSEEIVCADCSRAKNNKGDALGFEYTLTTNKEIVRFSNSTTTTLTYSLGDCLPAEYVIIEDLGNVDICFYSPSLGCTMVTNPAWIKIKKDTCRACISACGSTLFEYTSEGGATSLKLGFALHCFLVLLIAIGIDEHTN